MPPAPAPAPPARLTTVASFLPQFFLENLSIRRDNSMLITVATRRELWYLPPPRAGAQVDPMLLHTFGEIAMGVVEMEEDVFFLCTGNIYTTHESYLHRLDLRRWSPGAAARPEVVLRFPERARGPNGCCAIAPDVLLVADCFAGLIWRLDFGPDGRPRPRVWLAHDTMKHDPDGAMPDQPGVNGVRFAARTGHLYYTSTAQGLFLRVPVDPATRDPAGEPELVSGGAMFDDFCIDEDAGLAYVSTHRENTIDRVPLEPGGTRQSVAGRPFSEQLIGPSSGAWGRAPGEPGRVAYFLTDGGTKAPPPDGIARSAKVLRVEFSAPRSP